jgi:predicted RNA methylase
VSASPERPVSIRFHTRAGLAPICQEEIAPQLRAVVAADDLVEARLEGPLSQATSVRTALHVGFPLEPVSAGGDVARAVVDALLSPASLALLRTFTKTSGPIRFRLAWLHGGHRRGLAWRCAELVRAASRELVNDPTASTWEVFVNDAGGRVALELVPRGYVDPRFAYRGQVVPASSHPTIAAALARVAPRSAGDLVWDPFVGAGAELVERARLGPYQALVGCDTSGAAIQAARANLAAAGIMNAQLEIADALSFGGVRDGSVSVILTNPPMGRRVARGEHGALLERFVSRAARLLEPNGALVWVVPEPERIRERAGREGLELSRSWTVDLGGFSGELAVYRLCRSRR